MDETMALYDSDSLMINQNYCCLQLPGLVNIQKTIENGHLYLIYQLKMVIFHSYVRYGPTHSYKWNYITPITKVIYIYHYNPTYNC